jgi:ferritin
MEKWFFAQYDTLMGGYGNISYQRGGTRMLTKVMEDALNKQINRELYSSYLYLSMSAYFKSVNLDGFAKWMRKQADEEKSHGMKIYDYVIARGGRVALQAIEAPKTKWASAGKVFEEVYVHEQKVTGMINALVDLSMKEKDHATFEMLQWFVREQVEEEEHASGILSQIRTVGDVPGHLFWIDHMLGKRE